jgi:hypothetical protein
VLLIAVFGKRLWDIKFVVVQEEEICRSVAIVTYQLFFACFISVASGTFGYHLLKANIDK